jgi:uncharacterized protein (TIGR03437 family)
MRQRQIIFFVAALCTIGGLPARAQGVSPTLLQIDVENMVRYVADTPDSSKFATNPGITPAVVPRNFGTYIGLADIVAVNGVAARGTYASRGLSITMSPTGSGGVAIADVTRNSAVDVRFEILSADGTTPIGTILGLEFGMGPAPPGSPLAVTQGNNTIVGGTGAYLGVRGSYGQSVTAQTVPVRMASVAEDPSNRRANGGGRTRFVLQVIPMAWPAVAMTTGMPTIAHANNEIVTASNPAAPGERLYVYATGLGPTRPGVDPGQPFPSSPPAAVNSPVQVTVNGNPAQVLAAVGFPGSVDTYQVLFQVPSGTKTGGALVQVSAAWIAGRDGGHSNPMMTNTRVIFAALAWVVWASTLAEAGQGAIAGGVVAATAMESTTGVSVSGAIGYRVNRFLGFGIEVTSVPTLKSGVAMLRSSTVVDSLGSAAPLNSIQPSLVSRSDGRATVSTANARIEIPRITTRVVPYVVVGGGVANVKDSFTVTLPVSVPGIPVIIQPQPVQQSSTDLALTVGGGVSMLVAVHVSIDADLRYLRLIATRDISVGRFGVGFSYRF